MQREIVLTYSFTDAEVKNKLLTASVTGMMIGSILTAIVLALV